MASAQQYQQVGAGQQPIAILRQSQDTSPDGSYNYQFETENGISVAEQGQRGPQNAEGDAGTIAQGSYQYTAPDGTQISLQYTADENGFQPQGAHLPVPPAIPAGILRALEYNAAHPEQDNYQETDAPLARAAAAQPYNRRF